ncbi:MAG: SUMF1/EgtB/PvdO family nonheme iron enzyme [Thiohalocapsa sp.]|uniref:SUMF1/EgtB/PvdO family nonheme iron enzyme n=1 Tax=Thiohalocapsa sp. TaxID=2497641 RepID=UPI0025F4C99F|nr:SUMF1/EgtB/PvdO family nonheme iron enzyme [Thiohalocapsa sp.]MCG6942500.1 SUMF1/EgtB/PvdO family nonheme iron enzyme [Thiohalocapsa sp.]
MSATGPHNALPIDGMIQEFRIVRVLGAGAFGIVYEARNTFLPQTVVIKEFLPSELAYRDPDGQVRPLSQETLELFEWARKRFLQEAKNLWELAQPDRHPNIVRVTRYGEENGTAYMFMDFEQGRPLSAILDEQGRLTAEQLEHILDPLLDGLERVHAKGIVHRDIKPDNIMIRDDFSPVLIDFGAARNLSGQSERSVVAAYTPIFAALEQHQAVGEQGPWTDIYSLGATLYLAVTGDRPRSAPERLYGLTQPPAAEAARGQFPDVLLTAIDKACELRPEDRPQSVAAWRRLFGVADDATVLAPRAAAATDLHVAADTTTRVQPRLAARTQTTPGATPETRPSAPAKRSRRGWIVGLALLVLLGLGLVGWLYREDIGLRLVAMGWLPGESEPSPGPAEPEVPASTATEPEPAQSGPAQAEPAQARPTQSESAEPEQAQTKPAEPEPTASASTQPTPEPTIVVPGARFSDSMDDGAAAPIMVWLPAGDAMIGSPANEAGRNNDEAQTAISIRAPFAMGETEITIGEYRRFVDATGYRTEVAASSTCLRPDDAWQQLVPDITLGWERPGYAVTDRSPVACVSWNDAMAYADWLSKQTGKVYRLPTEAEWEYAARAGTKTARFWGDDADSGCRQANTAECDDKYRYAAPAGSFPPNPFGLRDMLGNLGEWTCSDYDSGYRGAELRCGARPSSTAPRVFRGGSWLDAPVLVRAAARDAAPGNLGLSNVGFRVARELDPHSKRKESTVQSEVLEPGVE